MQKNPHALVLFDKSNQEGLPFETFLSRLEINIPAARQIVLAGLWIVIQKVGPVYGISHQSSEGIRMLTQFVGRLLNVGLVLKYGFGPLSSQKAVWEFEKEIHTDISQARPGEY